MNVRLAIGSDHGGFDDKSTLIRFLQERGVVVWDQGTFSADSADYPIFAARVSRAVSHRAVSHGIILCRTGNGVAMVANRFAGVRAGIASTVESARLAVEHNNANVLVIGSDTITTSVEEIAGAWLDARFEGGRHGRRVGQIARLDSINASPLPSLRALQAGQSIWLEEDSAELVRTEALDDLARYYGLRGLVPRAQNMVRAILEGKAEYAGYLQQFREENVDPRDAWRRLLVMDAQSAADALEGVFVETAGEDGHVCLDPAPIRDADADHIVAEAEALVKEVARPNVLVRVPGTDAGLEAVRTLTARGVSTLVTKIFSLKQYNGAAEAYTAGLEDRLAAGEPVWNVRSGAGVHVGPLESAVRAEMDERLGEAVPQQVFLNLELLRNRVSLALCQALTQELRAHFFGERFAPLAAAGANIQRLFWLDVLPDAQERLPEIHFAEELVTPFSVTCLTRTAFQAFLEAGRVRPGRLEESGFTGRGILELLHQTRIDLDELGEEVRQREIARSSEHFETLLGILGRALGR